MVEAGEAGAGLSRPAQRPMDHPAEVPYGIPAFHGLHTWVWKDNPNGLNQDWNPRVGC